MTAEHSNKAFSIAFCELQKKRLKNFDVLVSIKGAGILVRKVFVALPLNQFLDTLWQRNMDPKFGIP